MTNEVPIEPAYIYCIRAGFPPHLEEQIDKFRRKHFYRTARFPTPITIGLIKYFQATNRQIDGIIDDLEKLSAASNVPPICKSYFKAYGCVDKEGRLYGKGFQFSLSPLSAGVVIAAQRIISNNGVESVEYDKNVMMLADTLKHVRTSSDGILIGSAPHFLRNAALLQLNLHRQNTGDKNYPWHWPVLRTFATVNSLDAQLR